MSDLHEPRPSVGGPAGPGRSTVGRLLVSAIEHPSVLSGGRFPADAIGRIAVTPAGVVDLEATNAALVAVLNAKARREERLLVERFPDYAAYMARTPRFVPRPGRRAR